MEASATAVFTPVRAVLQLRRATWPSALSGSRAIGLPSQSPSAGSQASARSQGRASAGLQAAAGGGLAGRGASREPRGLSRRPAVAALLIAAAVPSQDSERAGGILPVLGLCAGSPRGSQSSRQPGPQAAPQAPGPVPFPSQILSGNGSCSCSSHHGLCGFCKAGRRQPPASVSKQPGPHPLTACVPTPRSRGSGPQAHVDLEVSSRKPSSQPGA